MLIGNSTGEYILIRVAIVGLRSVAPLSICYTLVVLVSKLAGIGIHRLPLPLEIYLFLEAGFYFGVYLPLRQWLQAPAKHPSPPEKAVRRQMMDRVLGSASDVKRHMSGWFYGAEAEVWEREAVEDFTSWSLFNARVDQLDEAESAELGSYVEQLEAKLGHRLRSGSGHTRSLRHTFEPVPMQHRPLLWYMIIFCIDCFTHVRLLIGGFTFYRAAPRASLLAFPPRPLTAFGRSTAGKIPYWYREHKSSSKLPLVFLHGIGIGLYAYVDFMLQLAQHDADEQIGIIVLEILPISSRICPPALTMPEMKLTIESILESHGWHDFVLLGHSYGTAIASSLLRDEALARRIKATMLMDPICFLLNLPDVAYNFTRRPPRRANEWMLDYFSSHDMMVSHTLARRFFWSEYILWKQDYASGKPLVVVLSAHDLIVPTKEVWSYLTDDADLGACEEVCGAAEWKHDDLEIVWFHEFDHAGLFASKGARRGVAQAARRLCETD